MEYWNLYDEHFQKKVNLFFEMRHSVGMIRESI